MNASPANLNSVNPVQTQPAAGKQQDSATPDTPFSQVLSSEIAQNRRNKETSKEPGTNTKPEAASQPAESAETGAPPVVKATKKDDPSLDPLQTDLPPTSDALLALAIQPDQLKPTPTSTGETQSGQSAALGANIPSTLEGRKGRLPQALHGKQLTDGAAGTQKTDPSKPSKEAAATFAGQLSAARQSDSMKAGEQLSDLMANPAMRSAPQAQVEVSTPLSGAAANRLAPSIGTTAWGQALGEKIVWMAAGAQQTASLTLNPPDLGPLKIVLNISNDQATASFFSAQPDVRQALEAAFPRLREMMNEAGIQLGQATVSSDTPQQQASDQRSQRLTPPFSGGDEPFPAGLQAVQSPVPRSGRGLVDTFA